MSKINKLIGGIVISCCTLLSTNLFASTLDFFCIEGNSINCSIGQTQISVDVVSTGNSNEALFNVYNTGTSASSIEGVYFDDGTLLEIASLIEPTGVDFTAGSAKPKELPGANSITPNFETTVGFLTDANAPGPKNGINPGESLGILFNLKPNNYFTDVFSQLSSGELRVGLHVQAFDESGSISLVNNPLIPVPLPPAFLLLLSALLVFKPLIGKSETKNGG